MSLLVKKGAKIVNGVVDALFHGTCLGNAQEMCKIGWDAGSYMGANMGNPEYLYLTTGPGNGEWYADRQGCDQIAIVKVSNIPLDHLEVDPDSTWYDTPLEQVVQRGESMPGDLILTKPLPASHFSIVKTRPAESVEEDDWETEEELDEEHEASKLAKLHSHASTQIDVPSGVAARIMEIGRELIPDEYLSGEGRVQELHVTVKYGVQTNEQALRQICAQHSPFTGSLGKTQVFVNSENNAGGIPVVVEVRGSEFGDLHKEVMGAMGTIADEFPYVPHITIAYVKEQEAQHFAGSDVFAGISFQAAAVILSKNDDDNQVKIPLGQQMRAAAEPVLENAQNAVNLVFEGKRIGYVGYRVDGNEAEISGAEIAPEWRGKGWGTRLYLALAQKAKSEGISAITSNLSGMTSFDADRVWQSLMNKGQDIEEIESVDSETGKPYLKWNLKKASQAVTLEELYPEGELEDENEGIGAYVSQFGNMEFNKVIRRSYTVHTLPAEQVKQLKVNDSQTVLDVFKDYAEAWQKKLVKQKAKKFDRNRIIVLDGGYVVDGNHHAVAAIKLNQPVQYIDLSEPMKTAAVKPEIPQVKPQQEVVERDEPATPEPKQQGRVDVEEPSEGEMEAVRQRNIEEDKKQQDKPRQSVYPMPEQSDAPRERSWEEPRKVTKGKAFKKWFGKSKVVDDEGNPMVVYHGTTHNIDAFDPNTGNAEGHYGKGMYFTDSKLDVAANYATDVGPDLTNRIEHRYDQLQNEVWDVDPDDLEEMLGPVEEGEDINEKLKEKAKSEIMGEHGGATLPVYLSMQNPVYVQKKGGTYFEFNYDEDTGEESGTAMDLYNAIHLVSGNFQMDPAEVWAKVSEEGPEFTAWDFEQKVREGDSEIMDDEGNLVGGTFIQQVYQELGFDGIIMNAWETFGPRPGVYGQKLPGMKMDMDTHHYIPFKPSQIKSAIGAKKFDPSSESITAATDPGDLSLANSIMQELIPILGVEVPTPQLKIVNRPRAGALGRDLWMIGVVGGVIQWGDNTTIELQKYIIKDERTLRRIIAHELCHHADRLIDGVQVLEKYKNFGKRGYKIWHSGGIGVGHGSSWQAYAEKYNAKYGTGFVTEKSDETYVLEQQKIPPFYIALWRHPNGKLYYSVSSRMTQNIIKFLGKVKDNNSYRITKTDNRDFMHGATIGSAWSSPSGPDKEERQGQLEVFWNQPQIEVPQPKVVPGEFTDDEKRLFVQRWKETEERRKEEHRKRNRELWEADKARRMPQPTASKTAQKRSEAVTSLIMGLDSSKYPEFPSPVLVRWEQGMRWRAVLKAVKAIVGVISGKRIPWRSINIWKSPWENYEEQQTGWEEDKSKHNRVMYDVLSNGSYVSVGQIVLPFGERIDQWAEAEPVGAEEPLEIVADSHKVTPLDDSYYVNPERGQETNAYADIPERVRGEYEVPDLGTLLNYKAGAVEGVTYTLDINDSHRGELFGKVEAILNDQVIGYVQFSESDADIDVSDTRYWTEEKDEWGQQQWAPVDDFPRIVHIKYVKVDPKYRRQGIGTAMYQKIQQEFPGEKILSSGTTDEGGKFRNKLLERGVLSKKRILEKLAVFGEAQNQVQHTDHEAIGMSKTLKSDPFAVEVEELHQSMGKTPPEPNPILPTGKAEEHAKAEGEDDLKTGSKLAVKKPTKFYHGTPKRNLPDIQKNGLLQSKSEDHIEWNKAIYLAGHPFTAANYSGMKGVKNDEWVILEIDGKVLRDDLMRPDDYDFPDLWEGVPTRIKNMYQNWATCPWQVSLKYSDQVAYMGNIPAKAIKVIPTPKFSAGPVNIDWDKDMYGKFKLRAEYSFHDNGDPIDEDENIGENNWNMLVIDAFDTSKRVKGSTLPGAWAGECEFVMRHGELQSANTSVYEDYQRQGVATAMYTYAEGLTGFKTTPHTDQSPAGRALWKQKDRPFGKGSSLLRKKAVEPWEQTEDEYAGKWNEQETEEQSKERYKKKREWQQSTLKMLSLGKMSPQDAKQRGLLISTDAEKFKPLPPDLYHVTTAAGQVAAHGLKTREELGQEYGKGLGGGTSQAISFTTDMDIAKGIYDNLIIARKVAAGEMSLDELIVTAQAGTGAKRPWLADIMRSLGQGDVGEKELDALKRGVVWTHSMGNPPTEKSIDNTMAQVPSDKWRPTPWSHHWTGGDGQERYSNWERDMNEQEKREGVFEFFKKWSFWREQAGGGLDPLYFMSDPHALGQVPESQIAILHFKPIPGAMGTQESALGEWRTYSGDAVRLAGNAKAGAVSGDAAGKGSIDAYRQGTVIHINWMYIKPEFRGSGWGRKAYESWESSLPKDIERVELNAAQDAGTGPAEGFWEKMGYDYMYKQHVGDPTFDNAMWKGVNGRPTPKPKEIPEDYWEENAERD